MNNIEQQLIIIPLHFKHEIYVNVFKDKNNKTLCETIFTPRYKFLKEIVKQNYSQDLETSLGNFLLKLKLSGDEFYKKFLNKYGDLEYSQFYLQNEEQHNLKGVYFYYLDGGLKYIGRCKDTMQKRINNGYGHISPKKCFIDGQSTNCKINAVLTKNKKNIVLKLYVMDDNKEIEALERKLIFKLEPEWNTKK